MCIVCQSSAAFNVRPFHMSKSDLHLYHPHFKGRLLDSEVRLFISICLEERGLGAEGLGVRLQSSLDRGFLGGQSRLFSSILTWKRRDDPYLGTAWQDGAHTALKNKE